MVLGGSSAASFACAIARRRFLSTPLTHPTTTTTARLAASASSLITSRSSSTLRGMFPDLPMEDESSPSDGPTILDGRELSRRMRAAIKTQVRQY